MSPSFAELIVYYLINSNQPLVLIQWRSVYIKNFYIKTQNYGKK